MRRAFRGAFVLAAGWWEGEEGGWSQGGRVPSRPGQGPPKLLRGPRRVDPFCGGAGGRGNTAGNGSTNDAWLSQTVDEPWPERTGTLGSEFWAEFLFCGAGGRIFWGHSI